MQYRRTMAWMSLLLILALAVAGCAPRAGAGETAGAAGADALVVDLPSIAIDVAADGSISLGNIALADLMKSLGVPLELPITADTVKMLTDAGVQHIQVANQPDGLAVFINGQEIPSIAWTRDQLSTTGALLGAAQPQLAKLLPVLTQLGIGVTLRLPVPAGAEAAPLQVATNATKAAELAQAEEAFVGQVGSAPNINLPIKYELDGSWSVGGIAGDVWSGLTGIELPELNIEKIMAAGIQKLDIRTDTTGLSFAINGVELPHLDWSGGKLANVIDLLTKSGMLAQSGLDPQMLQSLIDQYLPIITSSSVNISALFPTK